jgi:hypothetical protein
MTEPDPYLLPVTTTVDERERGARVALLPVGSFEQHGPFLPLCTDTVVAVTVARATAEGVSPTGSAVATRSRRKPAYADHTAGGHRPAAPQRTAARRVAGRS